MKKLSDADTLKKMAKRIKKICDRCDYTFKIKRTSKGNNYCLDNCELGAIRAICESKRYLFVRKDRIQEAYNKTARGILPVPFRDFKKILMGEGDES